jgi:hypothetical protein
VNQTLQDKKDLILSCLKDIEKISINKELLIIKKSILNILIDEIKFSKKADNIHNIHGNLF